MEHGLRIQSRGKAGFIPIARARISDMRATPNPELKTFVFFSDSSHILNMLGGLLPFQSCQTFKLLGLTSFEILLGICLIGFLNH